MGGARRGAEGWRGEGGGGGGAVDARAEVVDERPAEAREGEAVCRALISARWSRHCSSTALVRRW